MTNGKNSKTDGAKKKRKKSRKKPANSAQICANFRPSAKQIALIDLLINPADNRTKEAKCEAAGVNRRTFYTWLKKPAFVKYMNDRLNDNMQIDEPEVYKALALQIKRGNVQAIRTYYELKGKLGKLKIEHTGEGGGPIKTENTGTVYVFEMAEPPEVNGEAPEEEPDQPVEGGGPEADAGDNQAEKA